MSSEEMNDQTNQTVVAVTPTFQLQLNWWILDAGVSFIDLILNNSSNSENKMTETLTSMKYLMLKAKYNSQHGIKPDDPQSATAYDESLLEN